MNRQQLSQHIEEQCGKIVSCFKYKNKDYGGNDDGFKNFREAAKRWLGDDSYDNMFKTLNIYADKHLIALSNTGIRGAEVSERLIDIAVYALLAHALYTEYEEGEGKNVASL